MTPDENKAVIQEFYDQWTAGAIDFDRLFHADVTNHQPDREPEHGLDVFRKAVEGVMRAVPDSAWKTLRLVTDGDFVVCHNTWTGTYGGTAFRGVTTPQGKRFSVEHIHIYRLAEGKIAEHWVVRDDLGMMQQVGAISASVQALLHQILDEWLAGAREVALLEHEARKREGLIQGRIDSCTESVREVVTMAGELEAIVRKMFEGVDRKDFDAVLQVTDEDVQGVDELSRTWVRSRDEVDKHWRQALALVEDIDTELRDVSEATFGEAGVVTCWIEQDYTLDGNAQHISGPTTILFRRRGDGWKMVLFHSIPLPEDEAQ